jgi:hypothetical protein
MNDFLDSLVAARASAEVAIQPRTLSRFEPAQLSPHHFTAASSLGDNPFDTETFSEPIGLLRSDDLWPRLTESRTTQPAESADDEALQHRIETIARQLTALRPAGPAAAAQSQLSFEADRALPAEPPTVSPRDSDATESPFAKRPSANAHDSVTPPRIEPGLGQVFQLDDRPATDLHSTYDIRPTVAADNHGPARPDPPRIIPEQLATTAQAASAQPTVSVTIGRLEIRAVRAAGPVAPSRAESNRSRVMSLDQYLQRRATGGV